MKVKAFVINKIKRFIKLQHLFTVDHSWPCTVPFRARPRVPVAFCIWSTGLTLRTCNNVQLWRFTQINLGKSSLQIICTYRRTSYLGLVSDALGKIKENIKQVWSK